MEIGLRQWPGMSSGTRTTFSLFKWLCNANWQGSVNGGGEQNYVEKVIGAERIFLLVNGSAESTIKVYSGSWQCPRLIFLPLVKAASVMD